MQFDLKELTNYLNEKVQLYNQPSFIEKDPVCIPHLFSKLQDIEIAGFFAATLAWGNRTTIVNNCRKLMSWMGNTPHDFVLHHTSNDLKMMLNFAHRTFNATDLFYFIEVLHQHYTNFASLEDAFVPQSEYNEKNVGHALVHFHNYFFTPEHPGRTRKHVATPARNSACKRLNMYLRWMVRNDDKGVDFGLWQKMTPSQLICPLDVHVARVAYRMGLLPANKADWKNALLLTSILKEMNGDDPAVYDYALFSLGAEERF